MIIVIAVDAAGHEIARWNLDNVRYSDHQLSLYGLARTERIHLVITPDVE